MPPTDPSAEKPAWTPKDVVTTVVSVVAFLLSAITFYFTFLRSDNSLHAVVMDAAVEMEQGSRQHPHLLARLAISNSGNRTATLDEVEYHCGATGDPADGSMNGTPTVLLQTVPLPVPPRESRVLAGLDPIRWTG